MSGFSNLTPRNDVYSLPSLLPPLLWRLLIWHDALWAGGLHTMLFVFLPSGYIFLLAFSLLKRIGGIFVVFNFTLSSRFFPM
jgi:hypothetical protein